MIKRFSKVLNVLKRYLSMLSPLGYVIRIVESIIISWLVASLGVWPTLITGALLFILQSYVISQASDMFSNLAHSVHTLYGKAKRWFKRLQFKIAFYLCFFVLAAQLWLGSVEEEGL